MMEKLHPWAERMKGAALAVLRCRDEFDRVKCKEDYIYLNAVFDLACSSLDNMERWLRQDEVRFRNHQRNKKGILTSVEAYFYGNT